MPTKYPELARILGTHKISISPERRIVPNTTDAVTIRTGDYVAGILLMSELIQDNEDLRGKITGKISKIRDDLYRGVDFQIYDTLQNCILLEIDFTLNPESYRTKIRKTQIFEKKIILLDGKILLGTMRNTERYCSENPETSKKDVIKIIPSFNKTGKSVVVKSNL